MTECAPMDDSARTAGPVGALMVSTREMESTRARELWAETLDSTYCEMDVDWPAVGGPFDADIVARHVGELSVSIVRADPHSVVRTPAMISSDPGEDYLLCLVTRGSAMIAQGSRTGILTNGSFGFVDTSMPFVVTGSTEFEQIVLRAPRRELVARATGQVIEEAAGREISVESGISRLASNLVVDVARNGDSVSEGSSTAIACVVLDMIASAVSEQVTTVTATDRAHACDLRMIQEAMLGHLGEPDCTTADIGAELGMSTRYIHKLFSAAGSTPRAWLYARRLERARSMLLQTNWCVAEIGSRVGFRDPSHFSRAFRRRFGSSPARFRLASVDQDPG